MAFLRLKMDYVPNIFINSVVLNQRTEHLPLFTRSSDSVLQVISGDFYLQKMQCNIQFIDFVILSRFLLNPLNFQI